MASRSTHVITNSRMSFLLVAEWYCIECIYTTTFFIHSLTDINISNVLGIMNNATMNMGMQISQDPILISFGHTPQSEITGSHGNNIFNFLRGLHAGCTNIQSHQQRKRVPFSWHSCQHLSQLFDGRNSSKREVITNCSFNLHFPD